MHQAPFERLTRFRRTMCLICGPSTRIGSEIGHPVNGLRRFGRSFPPQFIKQFCRISRNYRRFCRINGPAHGSACLAKSAMKQRLGRGSAHIMPAANTGRVDESNSQISPPLGGCPLAAGLPRLAGGAGSAGRNRRETTKSLEQLLLHPPPNFPSGGCTSYYGPCFEASGRLHLAGQRPSTGRSAGGVRERAVTDPERSAALHLGLAASSSEAVSTGITFAITGSEKRGDEGAPLFTVRVDGVGHHCCCSQIRVSS